MKSLLNIRGIKELTREQKQSTKGGQNGCDGGHWHCYTNYADGKRYCLCVAFRPEEEE